MYVDDMELEEAWEMEAFLRESIGHQKRQGHPIEQLEWDLADVQERIEELEE